MKAIFLLIPILLVAGCASPMEETNPVQQETEVEQITTNMVTETVVDGVITIEPKNFTVYTFAVPEDALGAKIEGVFTTQVGVTDVLLMNNKAFENWKIGHSSNVFYRSGLRNNDAILQSLTPNTTYNLIFSNKFSLVDEKRVITTMTVSYQREV